MTEKTDLQKMQERQDGDYKTPILKEPDQQGASIPDPK